MPPAALTASYIALAAFGTSLKSAGPVMVEIAPSLIGPSGQVGPAANADPDQMVAQRPPASRNAVFNDIVAPSIFDSRSRSPASGRWPVHSREVDRSEFR